MSDQERVTRPRRKAESEYDYGEYGNGGTTTGGYGWLG